MPLSLSNKTVICSVLTGPRQTPPRKTSSFAQPEKTEITLPRLVLDSDDAQDQQDSEVRDTGVEDNAGSGPQDVVVQETVSEFPQDLTARSQTRLHFGGDGEHPQDQNPGLLSPGGSPQSLSEEKTGAERQGAVSYTHLTLPTSDLV